jgi:hypothetical protein
MELTHSVSILSRVHSLDLPAASSHPDSMLTHTVLGRGEFLAYGQEFRGPLIALGVSVLLVLAGRVFRAEWLSFSSGGVGVLAGWYVLLPVSFGFAPRLVSDRLPLAAAGTLAIALIAGRLGASRGLWPPLLLAALGSGWWLSGGPPTQAAVLAAWPVAFGVAIAVGTTAWLCTGPEGDPLRPALAAFTLAGALHVVNASWFWTIMALVPGFAAVAMVTASRIGPLALLPMAADAAVVGSAAELSIGRLTHGEFRAVDIAVLSPLLALWLTPRLALRFRAAGRIGPLLAAAVAGAIGVGAAWGAWRLRGR